MTRDRHSGGASVIVDSSKIPTHTLLLARSRELDVRMVHLVRDSRGVAYSNQKHVVKRVTTGEPTLLPRYSAVRSGVRYDLYNAANGALAHGSGTAGDASDTKTSWRIRPPGWPTWLGTPVRPPRPTSASWTAVR